MKWLNWLAISIWLIVGIYGLFYNITYIDEAKYLIKGWLMATGQVGYYSTPEFFYQHLPGGFLWYGLGQKLFGPNLLVARIQSWLLGLIIFWMSWRLVKLVRPQAKNWILPIMTLAPVATLYYSSAVPLSLAALSLVLAFYYLFKNNLYLTTVWFTLAFIIRENFLFTLVFYLIYLLIFHRQTWLKNFLLSTAVVAVFFLPGWPGIVNVLKNFPGVSWLLPVTLAEKNILGLNIQQPTHSLALYLQAAKEFVEIYLIFILVFVWSLLQKKFYNKKFLFLVLIAGFNFFAHAWSAFNLTPRAIVPYFAYIYPLLAVIAAVQLTGRKINSRFLVPLMIFAQTSVIFASLFQMPNQQTTIKALNQSATNLRQLAADKKHIVWLAEPMSLYLAGKVSYYPLINHTNFYKPSTDTDTVKQLGFWNEAMLDEWLDQADWLVIDNNRLNFVQINLDQKLSDAWQVSPTPANIWPEGLVFYSKSFNTR